jgi:hypothetical protein
VKLRNALSMALGTAAMALLLAPVASADAWDKKTIVSFPESVEFPGGTVVPPGSYVMKVLDSPSTRNVVQVFNQDQSKCLATVLTISTQRMDPSGKTIFTFYETPRTEPLFIQKWYYPGDTIGREFVYSKDRARYIANLVKTKSTTTTTETLAMNRPEPETQIVTETQQTEESQVTPPITSPEPAREVVSDEPALAAPEAPAETEAYQEPAAQPAPQAATPEEPKAEDRPTELPQTAGQTAYLLLGGALSFAAALGMKAARSRQGA